MFLPVGSFSSISSKYLSNFVFGSIFADTTSASAKRRTLMKRIVLLLVSLFVVFLSTGCGPSDAEKRAQQVAQAKDDALKLRQQLAQSKSGADAENVRQQIMKVLSDASLTVESI